MRTLVLLLFVAECAASTTKRGLFVDHAPISAHGSYNLSPGSCDVYKDITNEYRTAFYEYTLVLYKHVLQRADMQFLVSPFSIWKTLAALAEGADPIAQQRLFNFLRLPTDPCTRQKFYYVMGQLIQPEDDINIASTQTLVIDDNVKLNQDWLDFVLNYSLLHIASSPIRTNPLITASFIEQLISAPLPKLNLQGNSVILDSVHYNGLWTTAFADAVVQRAPFYDIAGQKIGAVDLMVMTKKVKMTYIPEMSIKLIELPVGSNGRYSLLFGIVNSKSTDLMTALDKFTPSLVFETLGRIKESLIPIEVAIPRFTLTSNADIKSILEDMGLIDMWTDPAMTKFVSEPAALPSSYLQHTSLALNVHGLAPSPQIRKPSYNASTGLDPLIGRDFIADRPFVFTLMDKETYTCILVAAYSQPTYKY